MADPSTRFESWGRVFPSARHVASELRWRTDSLPAIPAGMTALPRGLGRSYGDSCLNDGGMLIVTEALDRFIAFDRSSGVLRCEAGVTFDEIVRVTVPAGWFVPVTPGTKFVTVGGAIANDVHGKNHHRRGTFGSHVRAFELLRSDGSRIVCTPSANAGWFGATIGGLGLTGLVTWAEIQLVPVRGPWIDAETIKFGALDEFFELNAESERRFEYTAAWIDCAASGSAMGRGLYIRGNHSDVASTDGDSAATSASLTLPFTLPGWVLNAAAMQMMCSVYYHAHGGSKKTALSPFESFFWPLDAIGGWNRAFGPSGFFQYQCVIPMGDARDVAREILKAVTRARQASFVSVLKTFGDVPSPGVLSFPRPGVTLALDFPNRGAETRQLLTGLDRLVVDSGGALYPAKDARMPGDVFRASFPRWQQLTPFIDPHFSSSFWRRVTGAPSIH